jgi:hypothetical protein
MRRGRAQKQAPHKGQAQGSSSAANRTLAEGLRHCSWLQVCCGAWFEGWRSEAFTLRLPDVQVAMSPEGVRCWTATSAVHASLIYLR